MTVAAARRLRDGTTCFVGIGLPSTAANLARLTHAPRVKLIYESGTIGAKPSVLPLSIGDGELATSADTVVSTPEIFRYYLQGGRIDVGFLGAAQIDRFANINTTVIGSYRKPKTRLPGAGGAPEIAALAGEVLIIMQQSARSFVKQLDFVTSVGFLDGGDARARRITRQRSRGSDYGSVYLRARSGDAGVDGCVNPSRRGSNNDRSSNRVARTLFFTRQYHRPAEHARVERAARTAAAHHRGSRSRRSKLRSGSPSSRTLIRTRRLRSGALGDGPSRKPALDSWPLKLLRLLS
jgi:acyl CoA:acetate/3-ketoacid CoA transferase beta subunit